MVHDVEIMAIWLSPGHDFRGRHGLGRLAHDVESVAEADCVAGRGIVGDRYFDYKEDYKGQVTLFDWAVAEGLQKALNLPELDAAAFRRNVLVRGLDLNSLIDREFRLGDVALRGSGECSPCYWMDEAVAPGAFEWLKGRGGLRCRITGSGMLRVGKLRCVVDG